MSRIMWGERERYWEIDRVRERDWELQKKREKLVEREEGR